MGFFDLVEEPIDIGLSHTTACSSCILFVSCNNPNLKESVSDNFNGIMLLLPPPTKAEDEQGKCGVGDVNNWLKEQVESIGISWNDCLKINSIGCYAGKSVKGLNLNSCYNRIDRIVKEYKPKLIISFGTDNLTSTVGKDWTRNLGDSVKWRGFCIPTKRFNCWLMNTVSPKECLFQESFMKNDRWTKAASLSEKINVIRNNGNFRIYTRCLKEDIRNAYIKSKEELPEDPANNVIINTFTEVVEDNNGENIIVYKEQEALSWLQRVIDYVETQPYKWISADLETSGLKCYNNNQFIYSIGLYVAEMKEAGALLFTEKTKPYLQKLFSLNPRIVGANWKFDYCWLKVKANINAFNLVHDTVVTSHLLDQRDGTNSLKFNTFYRFGISYEDTVHSYLCAEGSNGVNNIKQAPINDLLYYNALDVVYTDEVAKQQELDWDKDKNPNKDFAFKLYHKGSIALAKMEINGFRIDLAKATESKNLCEQKLKELEENIKDEPVWKEWKSIYGEKTSLVSDAQIIDIFIKRKGLWADGISKKVKPKADREFLSRMVNQEPFIKYILEKRKWDKILNTYLKSYFDEVNDDGRIRSFYSVSGSASGRMSSYSPNLANQSSRNQEQVDLLKTCFIPEEGNVLYGCDFSGLENNISANITKDPYMISTLLHGVDMHRANCLDSFCISDPEFTSLKQYDEENGTHFASLLRASGKNFSFAVLFGGMQDVVAGSLWKAMFGSDLHITPDTTVYEHLRDVLRMHEKYLNYDKTYKGDLNKKLTESEYHYKVFEEHIAGAIKRFWEERMLVTKEWRDKTFETFVTTGSVFYPTGLSVHGIMSRNALCNSPVQGSGACVTLWCVCRLTYLFEKLGLKSKLINVIHDAIYAEVYKPELETVKKLFKQVMCKETKDVFKWLDVPLGIDDDFTENSWAEMH